MNDSMSLTSAALAAAVASLFAAACSGSDSQDTKAKASPEAAAQAVKCVGINECKAQGECASKDGKNACQGQNECKGQGYITVPSEQECSQKGGQLYSEAPKQALGPEAGSLAPASVQCSGLNACAGHSECAGADHACAGKNSCAGKGWITVPTEGECTSRGGKVRG